MKLPARQSAIRVRRTRRLIDYTVRPPGGNLR